MRNEATCGIAGGSHLRVPPACRGLRELPSASAPAFSTDRDFQVNGGSSSAIGRSGDEPFGAQTPLDPDGPGPAPPIMVPWEGVPFGPATSTADTAVRRLADIGNPADPLDQSVGPVPIELVALQLQSIGPITIPGAGQYDLTATVDADPLTHSPGTMQFLRHMDVTIPGAPLGTYTTLADFFANPRIDFTPVGAAPPIGAVYDNLPLQLQYPVSWQHVAHGQSIVVPTDPDGAGPLGPTSNLFAETGGDIIIHFGPHPVIPGPPVTPEPGTLSLLALGGLALLRRRR